MPMRLWGGRRVATAPCRRRWPMRLWGQAEGSRQRARSSGKAHPRIGGYGAGLPCARGVRGRAFGLRPLDDPQAQACRHIYAPAITCVAVHFKSTNPARTCLCAKTEALAHEPRAAIGRRHAQRHGYRRCRCSLIALTRAFQWCAAPCLTNTHAHVCRYPSRYARLRKMFARMSTHWVEFVCAAWT